MELTKFQKVTLEKIKAGKSLILIAPTGLGKTLAVTADLQDHFHKIIYATPLRALGNDIKRTIDGYKRNNQPISTVIHHGDAQDSNLFTEEVVITTYDQVVCAVPGLPLSLPLKAGHAIAGATLLSRLIFDEGHLAWGISKQALSILLGILSFRRKIGVQTILMTATLPKYVAERIAKEFEMELLIIGEDELENDEALKLRNENRQVKIDKLPINNRVNNETINNYESLIQKLLNGETKKIYFANTVERLQFIYDELKKKRHNYEIIVLHNRMPKSWRKTVEEETKKYFGKSGEDKKVILLTNQVAEAGLDISAPMVISDPAPVDTLIQRAGRCARWFRDTPVNGDFFVITSTNELIKNELSSPYDFEYIKITLRNLPENKMLSWEVERKWIESSFMRGESEAVKLLERNIAETSFALNLFDRAAQEKNPGEIAGVFRDVLSVNVAVATPEDLNLNPVSFDFENAVSPLQEKLGSAKMPETSSISLRRAYALRSKAEGKAAVIRYVNDGYIIQNADYIKPDDLLVLPSTIAYLHKEKGLCFKDKEEEINFDSITFFKESNWLDVDKNVRIEFSSGAGYQNLKEHTFNVMDNCLKLLKSNSYRSILIKILKKLEPNRDAEVLADVITQLIYLSAGFHDLGKANKKWQQKIREIDNQISKDELVGRSHSQKNNSKRIRLPPHTPPGYSAFIKTAELLLGKSDEFDYLIKSIALASARHHSSLMNPSSLKGKYCFEPVTTKSVEFITEVLNKADIPESVKEKAEGILSAGNCLPSKDEVPLMFPNNDLFPIYALAGRAILLADREDASGTEQQWT